MTFADLQTGDVFVLRWWLDSGPTPRHYLVTRREGPTLFVLRLEADSTQLSEIDATTFDQHLRQREVTLIEVYRASGSAAR